MRQILNVLIILCNSLLFSQTISEKSPYEYLFDEEQILIAKNWKDYLSTMNSNSNEKCSFWMQNKFLKSDNCNLLSSQGFYNPSLFNLHFRNQILGIRKISKSEYELSSIFYFTSEKNELNPFAITKVLVYKIDNNYLFSDYLLKSTSNWETKNTEMINYHFPKNYEFNTDIAKEANNYLKKMFNLFEIKLDKNLDYFISENCFDVFSNSGFDFVPTMTTQEKCAFYDTSNNIIYTTKFYREFHRHELIHAINSKYLDANYYLLSGLSIYHDGENALQQYTFKELFQLLENHQLIDKNYRLSIKNSSNFDKNISTAYLTGALIIDAIIEKGGVKFLRKVLHEIKTEEDLITFIEQNLLRKNESIENWLQKRAKEVLKRNFKFKIEL